MLTLTNVRAHYGRIEALKGVGLEVRPGEIVALIGANGAGKTTTLKAISGLVRATSGEIVLDGRQLTRVAAHRRANLGLMHVPEGRHCFPRMTVEENLLLGRWGRSGSPAEDYRRVFDLFPVLKERRRQLAATLSGGEQQMLAIGRALMGEPRLLMLDEPSMGLAPILVKRIFQLLAEIRATGVTLLVVEQNARMALSICDRAYVLETGRIVVEGDGRKLAASDAIRRAYLGE